MEYSPNAFRQVADRLISRVKALAQKNVEVGIPGDKAARSDGGLNNAQLGYLHEKGVPERGLPARPFLIPGVEKSTPQIVAFIKSAAPKVLKGEMSNERILNGVGLLAVSSVRKVWDDNNWAPLKESTIKKKVAKQSNRGNAKYKEAKSKADVTGNIETMRGSFQILVDTGALRQSITYVINGHTAEG